MSPLVAVDQLGCCNGENTQIVKAAFEFSKGVMEGFDGSHDVSHLIRVWGNASIIAKSMIENFNDGDLLVIDLATVLHDIDDHKYRKTGQDYLGDFFKVKYGIRKTKNSLHKQDFFFVLGPQ